MTPLRILKLAIFLALSMFGPCQGVQGGEKPVQAPPISRIVLVDGKPMLLSFPSVSTTIRTITITKPVQAPAIQRTTTTTTTREVVVPSAPFTTITGRSTIQATTAPSVVVNSYASTATAQYRAPTYIAAPTMVRYGITNRGQRMQCDSTGCRLVSP